MRRRLVLLSLLALLAAACGGSSGTGTPTPEPTVNFSVRITAENRLFDKQTLTVPANSHIRIELDNLDADPHNISVYESRAAEQEIFVSDTIAGRGTSTRGEFDAPPPGTYFFRCDVHPVTMLGDLIVQ